jgi:multimeric flavodoxin WrbA
MKVCVLNGCKAGDGRAERVAEALAAALAQPGASFDLVHLHEREIAPCRGCFGCWLMTPGECVVDDFARRLAAQVIAAECLVLVSPVTFGGYSAELKKGLDRIIGLLGSLFTADQGRTRHVPRYAAFPRMLAVGLLEEPDEEAAAIFRRLVSRNAFNFHAPAWEAVVLAQTWDRDDGGEAGVALRRAAQRLGIIGTAEARP